MNRTAFEDNPEKAMSKALETEFDEAMMGVYRQALSECDYKATRFLHMLHEYPRSSNAPHSVARRHCV